MFEQLRPGFEHGWVSGGVKLRPLCGDGGEESELSRFVASLGIDAEQTGQTYDVLVRGLPTSAWT